MTLDVQLANFAEWNPNAIIELNTAGTVIYANLIARTQFPDIFTQGLSHSILKGLEKILQDFQPNHQSEVIVYNREIDVHGKCYEQQIFALPDAAIYVYILDVTESKQLKAQAHFNDRLATVGILAAGVAHEISNPLTWILGSLSLFQGFTKTLKSNHVNREIQEITNKIDETVHELTRGIEQIRDITSSLKGLAHIDKNEAVPVDVHKIINMAISMASLACKNRAEIETKYAENLPVILSNPGKLHQVFLNLLINAAQAISIGDSQHNKICVSTSLEKSRIRIDVSDTGHGISPEILPKIFDAFFTTKPSGQGTGLGLSICQEIICDLKGKINVQSIVGKGTVFSVYIPVILEISKKQPESDIIAYPGNKKQILLVDDDPMVLKLMRRMLEGQGQITSVLGGSDAMKLIDQHGKLFDIIISDFNMPQISGSDLYHHAAKHYPGLERRFIFVTGGAELPWAKTFLITAGNPVLEKPFQLKDILKMIHKI